MPSSSLPRHSREEAKPGTNKYKDIVCSGRIWLQHKASCYRGHGYSNRLLPCRGALVSYYTLGSPGLVHLIQACPTKGCPIRQSPSFELNREAISRSTPKYKVTLDPCPLYSCAVRAWPVKQTHFPLLE